jgi:hypothetical protein
VDRRFYSKNYATRKTSETFFATLRNETGLEALNDHLVGVVAQTMQPAHASLRLLSDKVSEGEQAE